MIKDIQGLPTIKRFKKMCFKTFLAVPIVCFVLSAGTAYGQLSGKVSDAQTGKPLPDATVYIPEHREGTTTDEDGTFSFPELKRSDFLLEVKMVGYESQTVRIGRGSDRESVHVQLKPGTYQIDEVMVSGGLYQRSKETPYSVGRISQKQVDHGGQVSLMDAISEEPGIDRISLGPAINKPVIRGLSFSRVMTVYNGLRLENQQWGADHGLWVNSTGVAGAEVIKGPASIIYGSGALGGVIHLLEEPPAPKGEMQGRYRSSFYSNSLGTKNELGVRGTSDKGIFYSFQGAYESHADYIDGNGRTVGNSRFQNRVFKGDVGIQKSFGTVKLSFHEIDQNLGIIDDNEMEESLATKRNDRSMMLPFQEINDRFTTLQSTFFTGDNSTVKANVNYHRHEREEIENAFDETDLGLLLHTFNYDVKYQTSVSSNLELTTGVQGFYQENVNMDNVEKLLIPDAQLTDAGIYALANYRKNDWSFLVGGRYDYRDVRVQSPDPEAYILPGGEEGVTSSDSRFSGWTASAGATRQLGKHFIVKANAAKGFRAPDLAELFSNGEHPGTQRFELGNPDFDREENYEADLSVEADFSNLKISLAGFANYINNYIYFNPTEERRGNLVLWKFEKTDALLKGGETSIQWTPLDKWSFLHNSAYVHAEQYESKEPLPLIPPYKGLNRVAYQSGAYEFTATHRFTSRQNRISEDEVPTPAYNLLDLSVIRSFDMGFTCGSVSFSALNLLDKSYFNHIALTREFGIHNPGRNFRVKLMLEF